MKICSCGFVEFHLKVDDNVVKICCAHCGTVYFPAEIPDLPDTDTE